MSTSIRYRRLGALLTTTLLTALLVTAPGHAAPDKGKIDQEKARLQARFEQRYPQVKQYKSQGAIGETSRGLLEAVKGAADGAMQQLLDDENADRKALYALIAEEEGADADLVARRAAKRNFEKARKGEFLKDGGQWRQK